MEKYSDAYRLKQWYPGLPNDWSPKMKVSLVEEDQLAPVSSQYTSKRIPLKQAAANPDFWRPVLQNKEYEILSFACGNHDRILKVGINTAFNLDFYLGDGNFFIHSVKRLSDGEIFTIGDKVKHKNHNNIPKKKITRFITTSRDSLKVEGTHENGKLLHFSYHLKNAEKRSEEKEYEILKVKNKRTGLTYSDRLDYKLKLGSYAIHSVKRLSDGEVFTIGDQVRYHLDNSPLNSWEIKSFELAEDYTNTVIANGPNSIFCHVTDNTLEHAPATQITDYKILSFTRHDPGGRYHGTMFKSKIGGKYQVDFMDSGGITKQKGITSDGFRIHSVKRTSDDKIFTIGDKVEYTNSDGNLCEPWNIESFDIIHTGEIFARGDQGGKCRVTEETFQHAQPKFTTKDGVDLYQGNIFWEVRGNNSYIASCQVGQIPNHYNLSDIIYSTKQLAEDHLDHHKLKFSEAHIKMTCEKWGANYNLFLEMLKDAEKKV